MGEHSFIGYSPKFYLALQALAYQEFQYEPCDTYPPQHSCHPMDYEEHVQLCLNAMSGNDKAFEEIELGYGCFYLEQLFLQVDDVNLFDLMRTGQVKSLEFDKDGYYLAVLEE